MANRKTDAVHQMFRAFSDPTRLRILHLLRRGELCVGDLVATLEVPQPTASRHLRALRDADLVDCRKRGRWCFYSLTPPRNGFHEKLLDGLESCFREVPELRAGATRAERLREQGGCCEADPPERQGEGERCYATRPMPPVRFRRPTRPTRPPIVRRRGGTVRLSFLDRYLTR